MSDPAGPSRERRRRRARASGSTGARLADVARHAGVSVATASRVLNGSDRVVDPELAERVIAAADDLRYAVNRHAQATARGTTSSVSIMVGDIDDAYFSAIASGAAAAADARGLTVSLGIAGSGGQRVVPLLDAVRGQRPRALLVTRSRTVGDEADDILRAAYDGVVAGGTSVVFLGAPREGMASLEVRHREGAEAMGRALTGLGYRRIAVLAGPADLVTATERTAGLRSGAGRAVHPSWITHGELSREGGAAATHRLLESGAKPDAIVAVTDVMAIGAMAALRDRGIEPGRGMAIAGFDDIPLARDVTPALSTVRLPLREMGRRLLEVALGEGRGSEGPIEGVVELRATTPPRR